MPSGESKIKHDRLLRHYYIFKKHKSDAFKQNPSFIYDNTLKGAPKSYLCIIRVWSLICSVQDYLSLHFLPIVLENLFFAFACNAKRFAIAFLFFFFFSFSSLLLDRLPKVIFKYLSNCCFERV